EVVRRTDERHPLWAGRTDHGVRARRSVRATKAARSPLVPGDLGLALAALLAGLHDGQMALLVHAAVDLAVRPHKARGGERTTAERDEQRHRCGHVRVAHAGAQAGQHRESSFGLCLLTLSDLRTAVNAKHQRAMRRERRSDAAAEVGLRYMEKGPASFERKR